eukprot:g4981.t1
MVRKLGLPSQLSALAAKYRKLVSDLEDKTQERKRLVDMVQDTRKDLRSLSTKIQNVSRNCDKLFEERQNVEKRAKKLKLASMEIKNTIHTEEKKVSVALAKKKKLMQKKMKLEKAISEKTKERDLMRGIAKKMKSELAMQVKEKEQHTKNLQRATRVASQLKDRIKRTNIQHKDICKAVDEAGKAMLEIEEQQKIEAQQYEMLNSSVFKHVAEVEGGKMPPRPPM